MKGLNPSTIGVEKYFFHTIKLPEIDSAELGNLLLNDNTMCFLACIRKIDPTEQHLDLGLI